MFQYPTVFGLYKRTPSLSSQPSSLVSYRVGSTEDLYCDDELHPSLEHDPNMRLMDEHLLDRFTNTNFSQDRDDGESVGVGRKNIDEILFAESILSMSVPSTGPQSLLDTCSTLSESLETASLERFNTNCWTLTATTND